MQWSHIWYHYLKEKIAIIFYCMKVFKLCKRYLLTYCTIDMHHQKQGKSIFCKSVSADFCSGNKNVFSLYCQSKNIANRTRMQITINRFL